VAEDLADVDPNLAIRNKNREIESVRYTAVNAMLLNEFLEEHSKVQEQESTIEELKSAMTQQRRSSRPPSFDSRKQPRLSSRA